MAILILLGLTLILVLGFVWGQRKNLKLIKRAMVTLENVFEPKDVEYKWLGGVLGVEGTYVLKSPNLKLKFSLLMLPRHSWLYFPIAYLRTRGDKLYITIQNGRKFASRLHTSQGYRVKKTDDGVVVVLRINWKTLENDLKLIRGWL